MKHSLRPVHIILFMVGCMTALLVVCLLLPPSFHVNNQEIRIPQLSSILELNNTDHSDLEEIEGDHGGDSLACNPIDESTQTDIVAIDESNETVPTMQKEPVSQPQAAIPAEEKPASLNLDIDSIDMRLYLAAFYGSLQDADATTIRVVHYGDSQIEEDRITTQLRRALQNYFGGGGGGLIPLHQTIPTRIFIQSITMNGNVQSANQGPKRHMVYGPKSFRRSNSVYGPMGQVAIMDDEIVAGSEDITLQVAAACKPKNTESYFNRIRILKKGDIVVTVGKATSHEGDMYILPDSTTSATIHLQGKGEIYGISLETDKGVIVDNVPMRGSSGLVFTSIASNEMQQYFRDTHTRLIIMQFSGNVMPYTCSKQQVHQYVENMRTQIQYMKYLAPHSSILFIGPSDMCERKNGELQTYPMIPVMDHALKAMAIDEGIGYFSLYQSMGGRGSMVRWKEQGLAGGDYVHFTPKGANKAGEMLAQWIMND